MVARKKWPRRDFSSFWHRRAMVIVVIITTIISHVIIAHHCNGKRLLCRNFLRRSEEKEWSDSLFILLDFKERHNNLCIVDSFLSFWNMYEQPCEKLQKQGFSPPPASFSQSYVNRNIKKIGKVSSLFYFR